MRNVLIINYNRECSTLTICSMRASSKGDRGAVGGGGEEEDRESPSALLILSGNAAIICSANVSTLASSSPIKRNQHPSQIRKACGGRSPKSHRSQHRSLKAVNVFYDASRCCRNVR